MTTWFTAKQWAALGRDHANDGLEAQWPKQPDYMAAYTAMANLLNYGNANGPQDEGSK